MKTDKRLDQLEKFLLDQTKPHCEIDNFYFDRLMEYRDSLDEDEKESYEDYIEYIHSFIETELWALWMEIK